ncbi:MAG: hypothetical protein LBO65_05450 [Spirochaetaceae bacterium]|jgi:hypothetical protein|nr:hypothetical protein [Spirochaetaceae bacterium]
MKYPLFVIMILFAAVPGIFALDYGVLVREEFEAEAPGGETDLSSKTTAAPWFSLPLGSRGDLSFSAGISADWRQETTQYIPELFRLELSLRPLSPLAIRAGRISYEDPSLFTAKGYFDGVSAAADIGSVRLSGGLYYTGLLHRDRANVKASPGDPVNYEAELDYGDFSGTYFAPRRFLGALQSEFPGFITPRGTLHAGVLAQFDFSDAPDKVNSQYLLFRYVVNPPGGFDISLAGAVELIEIAGDTSGAFASSLEAGWAPPTALSDRVSAGFRWASGTGSSTAAYFPVVSEAQGHILKPDFSGIMTLRGGYQARFLPSLSAELGMGYFLRTDSSAFSSPDLEGDSYFLGGEVFASALWVPLADISLTLGGGAFFPQTGAAFRDGAPVRWLFSLGTIFSF